MPLSSLKDFLNYSAEKEIDNAAWEIWGHIYPYMATGQIKPVEFNAFKEMLYKKPQQYTPITNEQIIDEIETLIHRKGG